MKQVAVTSFPRTTNGFGFLSGQMMNCVFCRHPCRFTEKDHVAILMKLGSLLAVKNISLAIMFVVGAY